MDDITKALLIAGATAVLMWLMGWVRTFLARRVSVESPESKAIENLRAQEAKDTAALSKMIRQSSSVQDAIMDTQIIQAKVLRTVLEVATGNINGNVKKATDMLDLADTQFNLFLRSRVRGDDVEGE